jgi:hypothetical protein
MGTLKLMTQPATPDGSHRIGSPGGYEVWHFYAEDPSQQIRLLVSMHDGDIASPSYRHRLTAYLKRPTANEPPIPSQYPCIRASVYENEKLLVNHELNFPPGAFRTEDDGSITLGTNRVAFSADEISVSATALEKSLKIDLSFRRAFCTAPAEIITEDHHWVPRSPLCEVRGRVEIGPRKINLMGLGQHNHYFGTKPPESSWIRGGIVFPRASAIFHVMNDRPTVVIADETGFRRIESVPFSANWVRSLTHRKPRPASIQFGTWLILRNPRIGTASPSELQLFFDAYLDGEMATAWAEIFRQ